MKIKNQHGFSVVEALIVIVVLGLLGFTGWAIYHNQTTQVVTPPITASNPTSSTLTDQEASATPGNLIVSEWGIKLLAHGSDYLTYQYSKHKPQYDPDYGFSYDSEVNFLSTATACTSSNVPIFRASTLPGSDTKLKIADHVHIGQYYYLGEGYTPSNGDSHACQTLLAHLYSDFFSTATAL